MSRYTLNQAQKSIVASSLVSLGTGAFSLGMGADMESALSFAGAALGGSLVWYGAGIGPKRRAKADFASAVQVSALTNAVRVIFPRRQPEYPVPTSVSEPLANIGPEWLGDGVGLARQLPASVLRRWLISAERYERQNGRGNGLSRRRWVEGRFWGGDYENKPTWWRESYYPLCQHLLAGTSNQTGIRLVYDAGYRQYKLCHSADVTFALVYVADRGLDWKQLPSRVSSTLSGGGLWGATVGGMSPLSK